MKSISEVLSSLKLTTGILSALILWLFWGILLADSDLHVSGFRMMNSSLVPVWFETPGAVSPLLKSWFLGLCGLMGILGVNLAFCAWNRMALLVRSRSKRSKMLMLVVHVVFGLVALGHLGSFLLGYRYENVRLGEGETYGLPDDYSLTLTNVHFVDDPRILKKKPRELTPEEYHPRLNFVTAVLKQKGIPVVRGNISYLKPISHGDIQITLKRFTPPGQKEKQKKKSAKPGVLLTLSRNPLKGTVFTLFPIMIAGIVVYTAMTWRRPLQNGLEKTLGGKR